MEAETKAEQRTEAEQRTGVEAAAESCTNGIGTGIKEWVYSCLRPCSNILSTLGGGNGASASKGESICDGYLN